MAEQLTVSFIICTYNRANYLSDTLNSLLKSAPANCSFEILVIDNNSSDETPSVVQKLTESNPEVELRYIKETQQGLSHARNRGIKESNATFVVFLDDDIIASKSLIPEWLSFFSENPNVLAAGGRIHVQFDDPRPSWMSHFLLPLLGYHDLGNSKKKYPTNKYPFGGNMGFKKSVFEDIGLFDTDLGRKGKSLNAGEEKELFRRLRDRSADIHYLPQAFLHHRVNKKRLTTDYIRKQALGLGQSMKLQMAEATIRQFLANWIQEIGKLLGSIPLGLFYLLGLKPKKANILFRFRWWIWKGYFDAK